MHSYWKSLVMIHSLTWAILAIFAVATGAASALDQQRGSAAPSPTTSPSPTVSSGSPCTDTPVSIPNGGFEAGSLSPWTTYVVPLPTGSPGSVQLVPGGYNNSKHAVQLTVGYSAEIYQNLIQSCQATAYTISYAYKVLNATSAKSCTLYSRASHGKFHSFGKSIHLKPGEWTTAAYEYKSNLVTGYKLLFGLACEAKGSSASVLLDDIQVTTAGSIAAQGCPKSVELDNGGFDTGQFAPWATQNGTFANVPRHEIVSPGYDSKYALQLDFSPAKFTDWYYYLNFTGLCDGYFYKMSFATNWLNYTGPASGPDGGCQVTVLPFGCQPLNSSAYGVYARSTPGWEERSYMCQASDNRKSNVDVEVSCESETIVPAFSLQMDSFVLELESSASARSGRRM